MSDKSPPEGSGKKPGDKGREDPFDVDYVAKAQQVTRVEFQAAYPWYFLVGGVMLVKPKILAKTLTPDALKELDDEFSATGLFRVNYNEPPAAPGVPKPALPLPAPAATRQVVVPIRKVQPIFPSMITVGRTSNHDVVLQDASISRFHAFFRIEGDGIELCDAGGRNGTFVGGRQLVHNGPAVKLKSGDGIRFGQQEFLFLSSGDCWAHLRKSTGTPT